jgi:16S rRNA (cytosine1402-N4)-methyltransferase
LAAESSERPHIADFDRVWDKNPLMKPEDLPIEDVGAGHTPVLARQVLSLLQPKPGQVCLDCTVGRGGHAEQIAPLLAPNGRYIGLDVDPENLAYTRQRLEDVRGRVELLQQNFAESPRLLHSLGVERVDLLLADLGFSSNQMQNPSRGLSFMTEGPLDMRLDPTLTTTAADLINELSEKELADVIFQYGEERLSRKIARKIVEVRQRTPIKTTEALAKLVRGAYGYRGNRPDRRHRIDPATRTFMALRIAVNDELGALQELLDALPKLLKPGATAVVISFHSLEDRLVKRSFAAYRREGRAEILTRKPVQADDDEQRDNPRSRSAKLRAIRWLEKEVEI